MKLRYRTLAAFIHAEADLAAFLSFLCTLPRLENLKIEVEDYICDGIPAVLPEEPKDGEMVPTSVRHLTLRFDDLTPLTWILFEGQAAESLQTLHLCWKVPSLPGVLPNVQHLSVKLADDRPTTPASHVTGCLPGLERVYVFLGHGFWADIVSGQVGQPRR